MQGSDQGPEGAVAHSNRVLETYAHFTASIRRVVNSRPAGMTIGVTTWGSEFF